MNAVKSKNSRVLFKVELHNERYTLYSSSPLFVHVLTTDGGVQACGSSPMSLLLRLDFLRLALGVPPGHDTGSRIKGYSVPPISR